MPAIMVGASFGALYGLALLTWLPGSWDIQPGLYSLVAATATLGGVFRNSISLVVVVVEGTRGIDFLFGIITAVVVSNYVAHLLHPHGVYESDLEKDGTVFFLRPEPPHALRGQTAGSVMASPALGFPAVVPAAAVVQALAATTFNAFVVYDPRSPGDAAAGVGRMEGLVTRDQLRVLLRRRAFADEGGRYLNPPEDQAALEASLDAEMQEAAAAAAAACSTSGGRGRGEDSDGMLDDGAAVPGGGDGWEATSPSGAAVASPNGTANSSAAWDGSVADPPGASPPGDGGGTLEPVAEAASPLGAGPGTPPLAHLNLRPFSNLAALTVRPETPCPRVYQLFLSMSLRHLPVVDDRGIALGMITRKDLDHAAGSGSWRVNPVAPAPTVVTAVPPTWLRTISTQALRSLAVPAKARRLISVLSHRLSVSPHSAGSLLQRGEDDTSVAGGSSDASAPSPRPAWPQSPQRPGGGGARQQRQGPPPPDV